VLVETWQANAAGRYNHPSDKRDKALDQGFRGWARTGTDFVTGLYHDPHHQTGKCGGSQGPQDNGAAHQFLARLPRHQRWPRHTYVFSVDEEAANSEDPVLNIIEQPERRKTLIAPRSERDGATVYTFDIHLQGDRETVFFDVNEGFCDAATLWSA